MFTCKQLKCLERFKLYFVLNYLTFHSNFVTGTYKNWISSHILFVSLLILEILFKYWNQYIMSHSSSPFFSVIIFQFGENILNLLPVFVKRNHSFHFLMDLLCFSLSVQMLSTNMSRGERVSSTLCIFFYQNTVFNSLLFFIAILKLSVLSTNFKIWSNNSLGHFEYLHRVWHFFHA